MRASLKTILLGKIPKSIVACAALTCFTAGLQAQILVGPGGAGPITFDVDPTPVAEWATLDITVGNAATYKNFGALDTAAQTLDASTITTAIGPSTNNIGTRRLAQHRTNATGSATSYLFTQPTGVPAGVIKATLRNNTGSSVSAITVSYNYIVALAGVTDEIPGQRVFYSTNGLPNNWIPIPGASGLTANTLVTAGLPLGDWAPNTDIYLLWLDDNNETGNDGAFAIDNFSVAIGLPPCPGIGSQPQSVTVTQCLANSVSFSITPTGAVAGVQWFRDSGSGFTAIPGATANTYTLTPLAIGDSGSQFRAEVTGGVGCSTVTSAAATLTVVADTTPPTLLFSYVSTNLTNLVLVFSEMINTNNGDFYGNHTLSDTNTGTQVTTLSGQTYLNGSRVVLLYTDGTPLDPSHGYEIVLSLVDDACVGNVLPDTAYPVGRLNEHVINFDTQVFSYDINNGDRSGTNWQATSFDDSTWPSGLQGLGHESDTAVGIPGNNGVPIRTHLNYMSNAVVTYYRTHFTSPVSPGANVGLILFDVVEDGAIYYLNGVELSRTRLPAGALTFTTLANGAAEPQLITGPVYLTAPSLVAGDNVLAVAVYQSSATSSDVEMAVDLSIVSPQPVVQKPRLTIVRNGDGTVTVSWSGAGTLQQSTNLNSPLNWTTIIGATSPYTTATAGAQKFFRVSVP